jgi:hypothetical protein
MREATIDWLVIGSPLAARVTAASVATFGLALYCGL